MSLLNEYLTVGELISRFQQAEKENQDLVKLFGRPPYYFLEGEAPPYSKFRVDFRDTEGRQYQFVEAGHYGVRIPIGIRRDNPLIQFPQEGTKLKLTGRGITFVLRVKGGGMAKSRRATALIQAEPEN